MLVAVLLAGAVLYCAPRFLVCADQPVKSDAIVLFLGGRHMVREKEAARLMNQGLSRYLIIPAFHRVIARGYPPQPAPVGWINSGVSKPLPCYYEATHVEAIYAKQIMNRLGLKSAIMVSSPYHMRRIKMISRSVFGEEARTYKYVPTPFENDPAEFWKMDLSNWKFVLEELIKICWFGIYSSFISR